MSKKQTSIHFSITNPIRIISRTFVKRRKYRITTNASLNENSAWNWSLKRCACVIFLFSFWFLNASTYIWVYQKDVACFLHLKQLLLFILYRRANVSHPIPSFHHLHVECTTSTHTYTNFHKLTHAKKFLKFNIDWENIIIVIIAHLCLPQCSGGVSAMFRVSMYAIIRWFLLLFLKGRLYLENGCQGLDWDARYNVVWLGLIKVEGRKE